MVVKEPIVASVLCLLEPDGRLCRLYRQRVTSFRVGTVEVDIVVNHLGRYEERFNFEKAAEALSLAEGRRGLSPRMPQGGRIR